MPSSRPTPTTKFEADLLAYVEQLVVAQRGPADHGYLGWSADPALCTSASALTAGVLGFARVKLVEEKPVTSLRFTVTTAGTTTTGAFGAVYSQAGVLLGSTADQGTALNSTGGKTWTLTTPTVTLPRGTTVLAAILAVGGTGPSLRTLASAQQTNDGLTAAQALVAGTVGSGLSAVPPALLVASAASAQTFLFELA